MSPSRPKTGVVTPEIRVTEISDHAVAVGEACRLSPILPSSGTTTRSAITLVVIAKASGTAVSGPRPGMVAGRAASVVAVGGLSFIDMSPSVVESRRLDDRAPQRIVSPAEPPWPLRICAPSLRRNATGLPSDDFRTAAPAGPNHINHSANIRFSAVTV